MSVASATRNGSLDPPPRVLEHPVDGREPEEQDERDQADAESCHVPEWKKSCTPVKIDAGHSRNLPISQPAAKRKPNVEGEQDGGEDEDAGASTGPRKSYGF